MELNNISIIEESIRCPITLMPMKDPVTGSDGQTYEKDAIVRWLGTHKVIDVLKKNLGYEMGHILVNDYEIEFYKLNNITSNININKSFNLTEKVY